MKIKEVIVVEGKMDTTLLKSFLDCDTIETDGTRVNAKTMELIKKANETRGIIIMTDPDVPGMKIREKILKEIPNCKQAFVNKKDAIKKNKVGIAETDPSVILKALENVTSYEKERTSITYSEFLDLNLSGNSKKRLYVYDYFHLGYGNVKALFKRLNMVGITKQQVEEALNEKDWNNN